MLAATAYFVRGLQMILKTSKRGLIERAEELGQENDEIPLTQDVGTQLDSSKPTSSANSTFELSQVNNTSNLVAPLRAQDPAQVRGTGGPPAEASLSPTTLPPMLIRQDPLPLTRAQRWAATININLNLFTYGTLFLFVGMPVYYATGYEMPAQVTINILAYFAATSLPHNYKRVLHPVLVSSVITILGIWILATCRRDSLTDALRAYSTKTRYLQLWNGVKGLRRPGAGDVFSSVLDVSIVALALPMFQYRHELKRHVRNSFNLESLHLTNQVKVHLHNHPKSNPKRHLPIHISNSMRQHQHLAPKKSGLRRSLTHPRPSHARDR